MTKVPPPKDDRVELFQRDLAASVRDLATAIDNRKGKLDFIHLWNAMQHVGKAWEEIVEVDPADPHGIIRPEAVDDYLDDPDEARQ